MLVASVAIPKPTQEGFALSKYTREIGALAGLLVAFIIWNLHLEGLSP